MNAYVKPEDFREPEDFPERVLFLSLGTSPQIITEVIYALTVGRVKTGEKQFVPTKVIVLSTTTGIDKARSMLDSSGRYHLLGTDYGLELPEIEYRVIADNNNTPMDDIRTAADAMQAADCTLRNLRELTENNESSVHISLAGGRKTQGYYTGEAASLFARPQDRLSHVLVSEGYEGNPEFFYPTTSEKMIKCRLGGELVDLDANKAEVELADLPFQRRREQLPGFFLKQSGEGLSVVLRKLEIANTEYIVTLRPNTCEVQIEEFSMTMDSTAFAMLLMVVHASMLDKEVIRDTKYATKNKNGVSLVKYWLTTQGLPFDTVNNKNGVDFEFRDLRANGLPVGDNSEEVLSVFGFNVLVDDDALPKIPFISGLIRQGGLSNDNGSEYVSRARTHLLDVFGPKISSDLLPVGVRGGKYLFTFPSERMRIE